MGDYDVAQICENGHVANSMARDNPARNQDHCDKCGSPTIMACPSCQTKIRGFYSVPGVLGIFDKYAAPAFCDKCGKPFPWTAVGLRAAKDLADELDGLTSAEQVSLKESLDGFWCRQPTGIGDNGIWRIGKLNGILYLPDVGSKTTSFCSVFAGTFASN